MAALQLAWGFFLGVIIKNIIKKEENLTFWSFIVEYWQFTLIGLLGTAFLVWLQIRVEKKRSLNF